MTGFLLLMSALLALMAAAPTVRANDLLAGAISTGNPCGAVPYIDHLRRVKMERISISILRGVVTLKAEGELECATPADAPVPLSAGLDVSIDSSVTLDDCSVDRLSIEARRFYGPAETLLEGVWKSDLKARVEGIVRGEFVAVCRTVERS